MIVRTIIITITSVTIKYIANIIFVITLSIIIALIIIAILIITDIIIIATASYEFLFG